MVDFNRHPQVTRYLDDLKGLNMTPEKAKALGAKLTGNKMTIPASATKMSATPGNPAPSVVRDSGLLTLGNVASELGAGCDELQVLRLIARGHLKATKLGDELRILASELARYVASGAPDFMSQTFGGRWIVDNDEGSANAFHGAILKAMESHTITAQEAGELSAPVVVGGVNIGTMTAAEELTRRNTASVNRSVPLSASLSDLATIIFNPPQASAFKTPGSKTPTQYKTWGDLYLTSRLRAAAYRLASPATGGNGVQSPLERFYNNYGTYRGQALEQLLNGAISFTKAYNVAGGRQVMVSFILPHKELTRNASGLPALAF